MDTLNEFLDADYVQESEEAMALLESAYIPIDESLAVFENLQAGVSRREAEIVASLGYLDTDETPVEAFTQRHSSLNADVLMLGLLDGIAKVVATVLSAVWKVIKTLIRAITAPFRWAYRFVTGDSGGSSGGGSGGGSSTGSRMDSVADKLKARENQIEKAVKEQGIELAKVDQRLEKYLLQVGVEEIDNSGIGTLQNFHGALGRVRATLPPGILEALVSENSVLNVMGINTLRGEEAYGDGIHAVRQLLFANLLIPDYISHSISNKLFSKKWVEKFTDIEQGKDGHSTMTGWRGTQEEIREMFFDIAEYQGNPVPDQSVHRPMEIPMSLLKAHRYHCLREILDIHIDRRDLPIIVRLKDYIDDVPLENQTSLSGRLGEAVDQFINDPFWEVAKQETVRLTTPDKIGEYPAKIADNLDVLHRLKDPKYLENINHLWQDLDTFTFKSGMHDKAMELGQIDKAKTPAQIAALVMNWHGTSLVRNPDKPIGLAYTLLSREEREAYNLNDTRLEKMFNLVKPGGTIELPDETDESIYVTRTLQNLIEECRRRAWIDEANGYKRLLDVVLDNVKANSKIARVATFTQTMFNAVCIAAWAGLNDWMINVQELYVTLIALSVVHEADPSRHVKEIESIIGKKLTPEEKALVYEQFEDWTSSTPVVPQASIGIVLDHLGKGDREVGEDILIDIGTKFIEHRERGHQSRMRLIADYMAVNRRAKKQRPMKDTISELRAILSGDTIPNTIAGNQRYNADKIQNMPLKAVKRQKPVITKELQDWLKEPTETMPEAIDPAITEAMRETHAGTINEYVLKRKIENLKKELAEDDREDEIREMMLRSIKAMEEDLRNLRRSASSRHHR